MAAMPYDQLKNSPSVKDDPANSEMSDTASEESDEEKSLPPELKALGKEMGFTPAQSAALKEFVAACAMHEQEQSDNGEGY
jgi:hypothetical protein